MAKPIPFQSNSDAERLGSSAGEESRSNEDLRTYTNEEVSEIIRLALHNRGNNSNDTVNHSEMLAIGEDFGLSPEDIDRAFIAVEKTQRTDELEKQNRTIFLIHAVTYAVVQVGLFGLNVLTGLGTLWFLYPLVAWGMVVGIHFAIGKGTENIFPPFFSLLLPCELN